jgi:hypothetical protein
MKRRFYDFRVPKIFHYSKQVPYDRMEHLADDKFAFRLIKIVYRNLEVELEGNRE